MNQNVCPKCQTPNIQNTPFCVNCGQPLGAQQSGYANNPPAGSTPNYSANQPNASQSPSPPAKKSRMGMWLAIIGSVLVLGLVVLGIAAFGVYYYISSSKSNTVDINIDSTRNNRNTTKVNTSTVDTTTQTNSTSGDSSSMTDDEKYRLFYAASKVGDSTLILKVSKKLGIIDEKNTPTSSNKQFFTGMISWAMRDSDFVNKMDTKEKAQAYIDSQMP